MLEVRDLYVGYYKDLNILQGLNLTAESGKITTVLGANGVGKSTLLKGIYGFLPPQPGPGTVRRRGCNWRADPRSHRSGPGLYPPAYRHLSLDVRGREPDDGWLDLPKRQKASATRDR